MEVERNPSFRIVIEDIQKGKFKTFTVYNEDIDLDVFFKTMKLLVKKYKHEKSKLDGV